MRIAMLTLLSVPLLAQQNAPKIPFESVPEPLKYSAQMNLGEVLSVAVNSKGHVLVVNHPGSGTTGPLYGNASTQLLEFDETGKFLREVGHGVYGLGYAHSVRYDKYDNLWIVDKGTHSVMRFNPAGYVTLNLGRRPEGPDEPELLQGQRLRAWRRNTPSARSRGRNVPAPTDIAFDSDDNIYISDGYINSRVAKFDKHGNWIKSWGSRGRQRPACRPKSQPVQHSAQHRDRPAEQRLRRRSRQPPHPGLRSRRQVPAIHLPECSVRQDQASRARQPGAESSR